MAEPLVDRFQRPLRDLRISVTDRCNFRCTYCMPKEVFGANYAFMERSELLSFEEITRLARIFRGLGVEKVRLTGGEPTLRRDLDILVRMLAEIPGLDLTLTTNGSTLESQAAPLAAAGLKRITVSLDSLDDEVFGKMNDVEFKVARVLAGIEAASAAGLRPVKLNCVVKRSVNLGGVLDLAAHFRGTGHVMRFIEFMDVGNTNGWRMDEVVPSRELIAKIGAAWPIEPVDANYPGEVAERWRFKDGAGEIGFISSVTQAFCRTCNRARLSANGRLFTCLFGVHGTDLRGPARAGVSDAQLAEVVSNAWRARDDRYSELRTAQTAGLPKIEMSFIGG
ncbi:MAG: GTP 3',8-cyclase MoaA [Planctomycetes bacterium]|nr:GTP 3',8-cyclase MoaA [Planctomycetota bacterium]